MELGTLLAIIMGGIVTVVMVIVIKTVDVDSKDKSTLKSE